MNKDKQEYKAQSIELSVQELAQQSEKINAEKASVAQNNNTGKTIGRDSIISYRRTMFSSKMIGTPDELIPFAWRQPLKLQKNKKMTKVLKAITTAQVERELLMQVKTDR